MKNVFSREYVPIHEDLRLNDEWIESKGWVLGKNIWRNAIRDKSGRYRGYFIKLPEFEYAILTTIEEAEKYVHLIPREH